MNRLDLDDFHYPQHSLMDKWIFDNAALRSEYIAHAVGRQMIYNMTHQLALEERFGLDADVMIEVTQQMIDKYPEDVDEDDEIQLVGHALCPSFGLCRDYKGVLTLLQDANRYKLVCALTRRTPMPKDDANAMISYLKSYFDDEFPNPAPEPTCIPVEAGVGQYVCQCQLASQTGDFPTTKKTIQTTIKGIPTKSINLCDYSTWPKMSTTSITTPPTPVPITQRVVPGIITCNDIKVDGMYGVQTIADEAARLYRECYTSLLYAKPTGTSVTYGGDWNGFKYIKPYIPASGDGLTGTGKNPRMKWMALSVQYLLAACEKGNKKDVIGFRNPGELTWEDFMEFFVERSIECKSIKGV